MIDKPLARVPFAPASCVQQAWGGYRLGLGGSARVAGRGPSGRGTNPGLATGPSRARPRHEPSTGPGHDWPRTRPRPGRDPGPPLATPYRGSQPGSGSPNFSSR